MILEVVDESKALKEKDPQESAEGEGQALPRFFVQPTEIDEGDGQGSGEESVGPNPHGDGVGGLGKEGIHWGSKPRNTEYQRT